MVSIQWIRYVMYTGRDMFVYTGTQKGSKSRFIPKFYVIQNRGFIVFII